MKAQEFIHFCTRWKEHAGFGHRFIYQGPIKKSITAMHTIAFFGVVYRFLRFFRTRRNFPIFLELKQNFKGLTGLDLFYGRTGLIDNKFISLRQLQEKKYSGAKHLDSQTETV